MGKASTNHHYLVILCGGTGPRLWPLSTSKNPKQFLNLPSTESLLQQTIKRCLSLVPKDRLYIITNQKYADKLKGFPGHIILEPDKKNTTTAILYATSIIKKLDPEAIITTTPSDHYIKNTKKFTSNILQAYQTAISGTIVTLGIIPTSPNPSFGYIKIVPTTSPFPVTRFIEKPPAKLAKRLIQNQNWYWNSGIYTFSCLTLKHALSVHSPLYYSLYQSFLSAKNLDEIKSLYSNSPSKSFDRVISQRSHNLTMIVATFDWSDLGEWGSIFKILPKDENQIARLDQTLPVISIDSSASLVIGPKNKLVGLVGVKNLAIVDTEYGLLVCQLPLSAHVRDLVATIVSDPKTKKFFER